MKQQPTPPAQTARPGEMLRRAREQRGQTLSDAAEALRLPLATIAAIERDDYAALPESAYVLGYWHSYALLLGVDIAAAVNAHRETLPHSAAIEQNARRSPVAALARVGVTWGCAALAGLWLMTSWLEEQPPSYVPLQPPPETTPVAHAQKSPFLQPQPVFHENSAPAQAAAARAQESESAEVEHAQPPAPAPASPNEIIVAVGKDSWVEVHDAAGIPLVRQLVTRGRRLRLQGVPPFSVYVGNAEGVAVEYQGRPVQFASESGVFARFNVGL